MNFSEALIALKQGKKVKRKHWCGYWFYLKNPVIIDDDSEYNDGFYCNPTIFAKLKNNCGFVPASPYQEDLLAEDWEITDKK